MIFSVSQPGPQCECCGLRWATSERRGAVSESAAAFYCHIIYAAARGKYCTAEELNSIELAFPGETRRNQKQTTRTVLSSTTFNLHLYEENLFNKNTFKLCVNDVTESSMT